MEEASKSKAKDVAISIAFAAVLALVFFRRAEVFFVPSSKMAAQLKARAFLAGKMADPCVASKHEVEQMGGGSKCAQATCVRVRDSEEVHCRSKKENGGLVPVEVDESKKEGVLRKAGVPEVFASKLDEVSTKVLPFPLYPKGSKGWYLENEAPIGLSQDERFFLLAFWMVAASAGTYFFLIPPPAPPRP